MHNDFPRCLSFFFRTQFSSLSDIYLAVSFFGYSELNAFLAAFAKLRLIFVSFVTSVCPSTRISSATIGRICVKLYIAGFYEYMSRNSKFDYNWAKMWGTLHVGFILLTVTHMAYKQYR